jgi:hypothetical protein
VGKKTPWYAGGLRFECQRCGKCCRGEPGFVWVTEPVIRKMAEYLHLRPEELMQTYVRLVGRRLSLRELPGGDCVMWDGPERGCRVYPVRPPQCRTFPFWRQHLRSRKAWERLGEFCPGVGKGRLHSLNEIRRALQLGGDV